MGSGAGDIYESTYGRTDEVSIDEQSSRTDVQDSNSDVGNGETPTSDSSIETNAAQLDERFELHENGYFCEQGTGRDESFRQHVGADPKADAREFFDSLASDSKIEQFEGGKI